jgi:hypothetical protein
MKRNRTKILAGCTALFLTTLFVSAQDNYTIKMSLKTEGLPAEYAAYGEQEITTYLKGDKSKTEMSGMMGSNVVFYDGNKMTSLMDQMGNKIGFTASKEELEAAEKEAKAEKPKIEYTTEKKQIAGYECTKAIVTSVGKDKKEMKTTVWYTEKIKSNQSHARKASGRIDLGDLKGQPLAMEMNMNQNGMDMKVTMTTTEVSTTALDDATFAINTDGYKMMTYKEMMDKQKAAMQGK